MRSNIQKNYKIAFENVRPMTCGALFGRTIWTLLNLAVMPDLFKVLTTKVTVAIVYFAVRKKTLTR